jgi:hypothetical protein
MQNQVWSSADGALLKKLREEAGVEVITLARLHSLSSSQVKQLEDGGDSSFYTQSIKLATGRKLLMHFGADVQPLEPVADLKPVQEVKIVEQKINSIPTPTQTPITNIALKKNKSPSNLLIFGALIVALASTYIWFHRSVPAIQKESGNIGAEQKINLPPLAISIEPKTDSSTIPIDSLKPQEGRPECVWGNEVAPVIFIQPTKPGDYVHVVANTDASICIKDALGKVQVLYLKNTQSQTFRGRPPFDIFSNKLNEFKLFYQGNLLRLPSSNTTNINLKEQKYE